MCLAIVGCVPKKKMLQAQGISNCFPTRFLLVDRSTGRTTAHPVDRKEPTRVKLRPRRGKIGKLELYCWTSTRAMFLPDYHLKIVRCWSLESNFKRRTRHVYFGGNDFQTVRDMDLLES